MKIERLFLVMVMVIGILCCISLFTSCDGNGGGGDDDDDGASDDDGSGDDDTDDDDDSELDLWGGVSISEGYYSSNYQALHYYCGAGAAFYDPDDWNNGGYGEPDDEEGDCKLYHYSGNTQTYETLSAGIVTLTGANVSPIHLNPVAYQYGYYYQADVDFLNVNNLFDENDTFNAHVAGGNGIGPLDISVDALPMISITKPSDFDLLKSLPHSSMTFKWNKGGAEKVFLSLSTYTTTKTSMTGVIIMCEAPDEQGEIDVSGDLMEHLQNNPTTISVMMSKENYKESVGDRPISFTAMTYRQRSYVNVK